MARRQAPTLDDVARLAGVSRATVSRAVRGGHLVSASARRAIDAAIEELGYVPNQVARSLATRQANNIAVIVSEPHARLFGDPFFATSVAGVAETLESTSRHMALFMAYGGYRRKLEEYLRGGYADAALVISHHDEDHLPDLLAELRLPCAFLGRPAAAARSGFSVADHFVDIDNVAGGRIATEHLLAQGCRRIATITGPMDIASARERLAGTRAALAAAGLELCGSYPGSYEPASAQVQTLELLDRGEPIDGLFVASDLMAAAAIGVLTANGKRVPDDIRVIGFDDADISRLMVPSLSTVTNPWRELAIRATQMVLAELDGVTPTRPVILQPELVVRESTQ